MSKDNNLHDYLFDLADAIREKKGGNELINAQNFADEIRAFEIAEEIKSQDKEVEVASNGTLEVTPDEGFDYLNKVIVNTSVTQDGEGGNSYDYIDLSKIDINWEEPNITMYSNLMKVNGLGIVPTTAYVISADKEILRMASAIGIDTSAKMLINGLMITIGEGLREEFPNYDSFPRLTKEEFYTI